MRMAGFLPFFLLFITISAGCRAQQNIFSENEEVILLRTIQSLPSVLTESSGIEVSGSNRIWSHEDSGNSNELYCFDTIGNLLRTLIISNVPNIDWEDITADNDETWFIGDFGNNNNQRTDLAIYIIPDPETIQESTVTAGIIHFRLADQLAFPPPSSNRNYDLEAMVWFADSVYLFTKDRSNPFTGIVKMYVLPDKSGNYIARLAGSFVSGYTTGSGRVTAADLNQHTGELMLLTNEKLISFRDYPGNRFFDGTKTEYYFNVPPGQNEGLSFVSNNKLYMTEEGNDSNPGFLYKIILPRPQSSENELYNPKSLYVYPNPGKEVLKFSRQIEGQVDVYSTAGSFVKTVMVENETLDISQLKPGFYFISVRQKQKTFYIPFQKI